MSPCHKCLDTLHSDDVDMEDVVEKSGYLRYNIPIRVSQLSTNKFF